MRNTFDVIVVGGGHAGIEAAAASARLGRRTALVTGNLDTIGKMSCNPAIGGMAKGQLAREVDALGGLMGQATDACGIQFRLLGLSKGPAMWSPRAQCDKAAYGQWMIQAVHQLPNCYPLQGDVIDLERDAHGAIAAVQLRDGRRLQTSRVVVTTGTFLGGLLHQGEAQTAGGRMGCAPANGISDRLRQWGLKVIRQKTGTPMRLHAAGIHWDLCDEQAGDTEPRPFSFRKQHIEQHQISCWSCYSSPEAHEIIRANRHRAPMYNGQITSVGPRYCPSIEDKVTRFADRDRHHLFLEPEGRHSQEVYVNGLATSLPIDVQDQILDAIPALAGAHVLRYGYAVEYDAVVATQLDHHLAVRGIPGLYLAGQINGTSGYEEAALQGLVAGANAALSLDGADPLELSRGDGYGGVLIDDLVVRAPEEPYRMFTSRAEHRLQLRADNADRRLCPLAARAGLIDTAWAASVAEKEHAIQTALADVPDQIARRVAGEAWNLAHCRQELPQLQQLDAAVAEQVWIELRYAAYLERQQATIAKLGRMHQLRLPPDLNLDRVPSLSAEGKRVLQERQPSTLGEASRLPGVLQTDIETIWSMLARGAAS